jgi:alcohol dehydrogenase class IV
MGFKKALVWSDKGLIKVGTTKMVTDVLDEVGFPYEIYSEIKPNPTVTNVQQGVAAFKASGADCIIAIGGGSSIDTAKGIGIVAITRSSAMLSALRVLRRQSTRVCPSSHCRRQLVRVLK